MPITRVRWKRGTAADWTGANPVLRLGEPGWETDTQTGKVGDGVTAWNDLAYHIGAGGGGGGGGGLDTAAIHAAASKTTPVDADEFLLLDSAATFSLKKLTWANAKATIATYLASLTQTLTNKDLSSGTNLFPTSLYKSGGSDVAITDGGTGVSTLPAGLMIGAGTGAITAVTAPSGTVVGTTDTQTLTNKRINPRVVTLTDAATVAVNGDTTDVGLLTIGGNRTLGAPSGTPVDGQLLHIRVTQDSTGSRTLAYNSIYSNPGGNPTLTTTAAAVDSLTFRYNAALTKWVLQSFQASTGSAAVTLATFVGLAQMVFFTTVWPTLAEYSDAAHSWIFVGGDDTHTAPSVAGNALWVRT